MVVLEAVTCAAHRPGGNAPSGATLVTPVTDRPAPTLPTLTRAKPVPPTGAETWMLMKQDGVPAVPPLLVICHFTNTGVGLAS